VTLRLTSAMYHRFHARPTPSCGTSPTCQATPGTSTRLRWQRVERLFCRNERAVLNLR
jgi:phosphatidylserine decarboxylase